MTTLRVLGRQVAPLERIETIGELLGLKRGAAYRLAKADSWPLVGPQTAHRVNVIALLDRMCIPYDVQHAPDAQSLEAEASVRRA